MAEVPVKRVEGTGSEAAGPSPALSSRGEGRAWSVVAAASLFVVTLAVYSGAVRLGWTGWDDTAYITNNPAMETVGGLRAIWTGSGSEQYYPVTFSAWWGLHRWFGDEPAAYHAANAALHALNAALLFALVRRLSVGRAAAMFAALAFALHPMQVMSVAWIAELKNVLSLTLCLLAMLCWAGSRAAEARTRGRARGTAVFLLGMVLFAAALLGKSVLVGVPLAWAVLDRRWFGASWVSVVMRAGLGLAVGAGAVAMTVAMERKFVGGAGYVPELAERLQIAGAAPWWYVGKLIWPVGLSPVYEVWSVGREKWVWWVPLGALAAVVGWMAWGVLRSGGEPSPGSRTWPPLPRGRGRGDAGRGRVAWGLAHFLCVLGPTLGVVAFGNLSVSFVSDHFLYAASLGVFAAIGVGLDRMKGVARRIGMAGAFAAIAVFGVMTALYVPVFADGVSMWGRAVKVSPGNFAANMGLGESLRQAGKATEALTSLRRAVALRPRVPDGYLFLAAAEAQAGDVQAAEESLRRALDLDLRSIDAMTQLAELCRETGRPREALEWYEKAAAEKTDSPVARETVLMGLGQMYLGYRRYEDALRVFGEAAGQRATNARAWLGVATSERGLGRGAEAVKSLREGIAANPRDISLHNMLALILATSRDDAVRDGSRAVEEAGEAVRLGGGYVVLDTLAAAYAEAGRWDDAVRTAEEAARGAEQAGDAPAAAESRRRGEMYAQHRAMRL